MAKNTKGQDACGSIKASARFLASFRQVTSWCHDLSKKMCGYQKRTLSILLHKLLITRLASLVVFLSPSCRLVADFDLTPE